METLDLKLKRLEVIEPPELKETDGGVLLITAALGYYLYKNWDDVAQGYKNGFK